MTLALDASHDLFLGSRSGIAIASEGAAVAQGILTRLRLFRGEWYLRVQAGMPWLEDVFTARPDIRQIERSVKRQILNTPGVEEILSFGASFGPNPRDLSITFEVDTLFGPSGVLEVTL